MFKGKVYCFWLCAGVYLISSVGFKSVNKFNVLFCCIWALLVTATNSENHKDFMEAANFFL